MIEEKRKFPIINSEKFVFTNSSQQFSTIFTENNSIHAITYKNQRKITISPIGYLTDILHIKIRRNKKKNHYIFNLLKHSNPNKLQSI